MSTPEGCNHSSQSWWKDKNDVLNCADCEDSVRDDPDKIYYKGRIVTLGGRPINHGIGRNPLCCGKARKGDFYFCVCNSRSYCPDHGIQCNGSHS